MEGLCTIYSLENTANAGRMPVEQLVEITTAYYEERTVGVTRAYAALSADQRIDMLIRVFNTDLTTNAEYVILEDGNQYRIELKQRVGDAIDLTLVRLEEYLDVYTE